MTRIGGHPARAAAVPALIAMLLAGCGAVAGAPCPEGRPSATPVTPYHDDGELEARFPEEVAGEQLEMLTYCASTVEEGGFSTAPALLAELGVDLADVTVARSAPPRIGETDTHAGVTAWRYRGAETDRLLAAYLDSWREMAAEVGFDPPQAVVLGGKDAYILQQAETAPGTEVLPLPYVDVLHVAGDTAYIVSGRPDVIEELLAALP
jgi:hypothetical protein